jgi:predicted RNA binding protein YcfA (HicA-like mRNA interferase family)
VTRLPQVDAARLIRALKRGGFVEHEHKGSHLTLKHPVSGLHTTVPTHGGDVGHGLLKQILKQAGITEAEFRKLLRLCPLIEGSVNIPRLLGWILNCVSFYEANNQRAPVDMARRALTARIIGSAVWASCATA